MHVLVTGATGFTGGKLVGALREAGHTVEERPISFDEWKANAQNGTLREVFACGTAAVVAGIGSVKFSGGSFAIGNSGDGPTTAKIRKELVGIQRGQVKDRHKWMRQVA